EAERVMRDLFVLADPERECRLTGEPSHDHRQRDGDSYFDLVHTILLVGAPSRAPRGWGGARSLLSTAPPVYGADRHDLSANRQSPCGKPQRAVDAFATTGVRSLRAALVLPHMAWA